VCHGLRAVAVAFHAIGVGRCTFIGDHSVPTGPLTAFYFSVITQLTIGYGDVCATGWLRIIAAGQGLIGALFVVAVLGRAVSAREVSGDMSNDRSHEETDDTL
jgi:Ion channel